MQGSDRGLRMPARACYSSGTGDSDFGVKLSERKADHLLAHIIRKFPPPPNLNLTRNQGVIIRDL